MEQTPEESTNLNNNIAFQVLACWKWYFKTFLSPSPEGLKCACFLSQTEDKNHKKSCDPCKGGGSLNRVA